MGLSVGGSFAALGLVVGGFLRAALVFFGPVLTFLRRGKVCWKVILLGHCAGEPSREPPPSPPWGVYPRVGGGTHQLPLRRGAVHGLSPRGRGNLQHQINACLPLGSIPAWAGEPVCRSCSLLTSRVYPRVGGGTMLTAAPTKSSNGLSPRGRGNLRPCPSGARRTRSVPAWAGEPSTGRTMAAASGVYPRVGGGTVLTFTQNDGSTGLSPRGRGNRDGIVPLYSRVGSIPAWAGNHTGELPMGWSRGSIPAWAGEP